MKLLIKIHFVMAKKVTKKETKQAPVKKDIHSAILHADKVPAFIEEIGKDKVICTYGSKRKVTVIYS